MVFERPTRPAFDAETAMAFGSSHTGSCFDGSRTRAREDAGTISTGNSGVAGVGVLGSMETAGMASAVDGSAIPDGGCAAKNSARYSSFHWSSRTWVGLLPVSLA